MKLLKRVLPATAAAVLVLAISSKFTFPALGMDSFELPWALNVKPA